MKNTTDLCFSCKDEFTSLNRLVYRGLCLKCYGNSSLPCDRCQIDMKPETHRTNNGSCFDCFYSKPSKVDEEDRAKLLSELERQCAIELPPEYQEFLLKHDGHQRYSHKSLKGKDWYMASILPEHDPCLSKACLIDNQTPFFKILSVYASHLREVEEKQIYKLDSSIKKFGLDRLAAGFAIAEENSDILFLDKESNSSLWCFYHDGEIVQVESDFGQWIKKAKKLYKPIKYTAKAQMKRKPDFVGYWLPVTKPKVTVAHLNDKHYQFLSDDRAKCIYYDAKKDSITSESFGTWRLFGKDKLGFQSDGDEDTFILLADGNIRSSINPDFDVTYKKRTDNSG